MGSVGALCPPLPPLPAYRTRSRLSAPLARPRRAPTRSFSFETPSQRGGGGVFLGYGPVLGDLPHRQPWSPVTPGHLPSRSWSQFPPWGKLGSTYCVSNSSACPQGVDNLVGKTMDTERSIHTWGGGPAGSYGCGRPRLPVRWPGQLLGGRGVPEEGTTLRCCVGFHSLVLRREDQHYLKPNCSFQGRLSSSLVFAFFKKRCLKNKGMSWHLCWGDAERQPVP